MFGAAGVVKAFIKGVMVRYWDWRESAHAPNV
jgi:hypothetical protein